MPSPSDSPTAAGRRPNGLAGLRFKRKTRPVEQPRPSSPSSASSPDVPLASQRIAPIAQPAESPLTPPPATPPPATSIPSPNAQPGRVPEVEPPVGPPIFRVTHHGQAPAVCQAFEGRVAAQGFFRSMVVTSPNMDFVPQYPVERGIVDTYADGRWGLREYSRWPQMLVPDMMHIACIPREPSGENDPVLWKALLPSTAWEEDPLTGVSGLGFIKSSLRASLRQAASLAITRFEADVQITVNSPTAYRDHGSVLVMILRQVVERMDKLASPAGVAIAVGAHVQRICLELAGLCTYLEVVHRRLIDPLDHSSDILPVLGTFVREGTGAQTCRRIGLPTWFLQPLTHTVAIWQIVPVRTLPDDLSGSPCHPPIHHQAGAVAGVTNLTGNWLRVMALAVSKLVCRTHIPALTSADEPVVLPGEDEAPPAKRPKLFEAEPEAKHLGMRKATSDKPAKETGKKNRRERKRLLAAATGGQPEASGSQPEAASGAGPTAERTDAIQPAKAFLRSPFYSVPQQWAQALTEASPVPRGPASALYFFPPPFLLDTVSSQIPLPPDSPHPDASRNDNKILRYLHNFLRIRRFCRARLFDPSLSCLPLTIVEWRAALWGDYGGRTNTPTGAVPREVRRAGRRRDGWNAICRLLGRVALLPSYREDLLATFRGATLRAKDLPAAGDVRQWILWESHEINFRCEVMALDTLLVHREDWQELDRWVRESEVSRIWGSPASVLSVLPPDDLGPPDHLGAPDDLSADSDRVSGAAAHWPRSREHLAAFVGVMRRWPDFPADLLAALSDASSWDDRRCAEVSQGAINYYVETFVRMYQRLPTPPIPAVP